MQNYKEINGNDYVKDSRTTINETMRSIQSMNSGTVFPTTNLFEGMKCYRTDLKKTYTLTDVENNTWVEDDTASKLSTARKINITGNATGAANFDGSGDISINTTVNESKHAAAATSWGAGTTALVNDIATTNNSDTWIPVVSNGKLQHTEKLNMKVGAAVNADTAAACSGNSATATKLAGESGSNYLETNTTTNSWNVLGSNPGVWLKSIRTNASAPPYSIGNFSAAVAFGGRDTKGIITHAYDGPLVKFAGGNGSTAQWKFSIYGGSNNEVYDLNNFPTKTGSGASGTWGINISGTATNADELDGYHASDILNRITAANTGGIVAASLTANGYIKFANGLILQWGVINNTKSNTRYSVTFPVSFASACFGVHSTYFKSTGDSQGSGDDNMDTVANITKNGCQLLADNQNVFWTAIGV